MGFKFFKNNDAVSQLIGYILTLSITSGLMVGIVLMSNEQINNSNKDAANLMAQDIANVVTEGVLGAVSTRRLMENAAFEFELDVPTTLAGKSYYVDIADKFVYVNSTDGTVSKKGSNFNAGEFGFGISGKAYGSTGKIKVFCEKNEDVCKFDFGTRESSVSSGYIQINPDNLHNDLNPVTGSWWDSNWKNRLLVTINNQVYGYDMQLNLMAQDLYDFQYRFTLKPSYFDYNKAKEDGSDIRVINNDNNEQLDHWVESWNPLGPSKVWVKLGNLSKKEIMNISIYYGNDNPEDGYVQDPAKVFNFYDDFDTLNNWSSPFSVSILKDDDESYLNITQRNATVLNVESLGPGMSVGSYNGILHFRGPGYKAPSGPVGVVKNNFVMYTLYMVEAMMDLSSNYSVSEEEAGSQSGMTGASGGKATTGASMGVMMNLPSSAIITGGYPQDYIIERGFLDESIEDVSAGESVVSASDFVGFNGFPTSTTSNTVEEVFSSTGIRYIIDFDTDDPPDGNPEGSFTAMGNQKVLSIEITGHEPFVFIDWKWKDVSALSVYNSPFVTDEAKICIMDSGGSFIEAYVTGKTIDTSQPSRDFYQISIMDVTDEGNYIAYPPSSSYGIVSKAINVAKPTIEDLFNISYVTTSSYNNPGYTLYKNWPLATNPNKLCESSKNSTYPNWFLQRTGVFIGRTYNLSASQIYQNYTIIGNTRFNCTWDKQLSVAEMLDDVWDTDESITGFSESAEGIPIIEGNIGFALGLNDGGKEGTGNLLVDWVRIYQTTMYDLNVTFNSQESLYYGWNDTVQGIYGDLNTYLLYDNNYGTNKKTFIVEELPKDEALTVTVQMGSNKATMPAHDTTINIYDGSNNYIKSVHAQDTEMNYTTLLIPIEKRYSDGTLKFEFEDGGSVPWLVNSIKIEKGFKKIQISEGYA